MLNNDAQRIGQPRLRRGAMLEIADAMFAISPAVQHSSELKLLCGTEANKIGHPFRPGTYARGWLAPVPAVAARTRTAFVCGEAEY